jgi:spore coat polysaccharide biosynthesis predicted glycosyltransferase SpsG
MKVLFLTEGGKDKGFGHITRCIAIAQGFNQFYPAVDVHFIINSDNSVEKLLSEFESVEYFDWINSREKIYEIITKEKIVIIDSYYAPYDLLNDISEKAKICVYIDDYNRIEYPEGIIVNGTIGAENIPYNKKEG